MQWLGLCIFTAESTGSLGWGAMILQAMCYGQKINISLKKSTLFSPQRPINRLSRSALLCLCQWADCSSSSCSVSSSVTCKFQRAHPPALSWHGRQGEDSRKRSRGWERLAVLSLSCCRGHFETLSVLQQTALHWSAYYNNPEHVKLLIKHDSNIGIPDVEGKIPLHWAANHKDPSAVHTVRCILVGALGGLTPKESSTVCESIL